MAAHAYSDSKQRDVHNKREPLVGDVNPQYLSNKKKCVGDKGSKNTVSVQMTAEEDENSAIDGWPDYFINALIVEDQDGKVRNLYFQFYYMIHFDKSVFARASGKKIFLLPEACAERWFSTRN